MMTDNLGLAPLACTGNRGNVPDLVLHTSTSNELCSSRKVADCVKFGH
jgi:hypothetical protein